MHKRKAKEMASDEEAVKDLSGKRSDLKLTPSKDPNGGQASVMQTTTSAASSVMDDASDEPNEVPDLNDEQLRRIQLENFGDINLNADDVSTALTTGGDPNLSVIEEEVRASQFRKAGPNGTAAAPGGVSYQAMVH